MTDEPRTGTDAENYMVINGQRIEIPEDQVNTVWNALKQNKHNLQQGGSEFYNALEGAFGSPS